MGDAIVLAASGSGLEAGYNKFFGKIFDTPAGTVFKNVAIIIAIVLGLTLLAAWIMKGMGRQNQLVSRFAQTKTTIWCLVAIVVLAGPTIMFPLGLKLLDMIINALGDFAPSLLS